jgi:type II secretion system protein I
MIRLRSVSGFTLIEVLVALVVVTAGLTIIAQGFLSGGRTSVVAQNRSVAAMLAESKMAEIEEGIVSMSSSSSGTFEPERPDFTWTVEPESTVTTGLSKVTLTVLWKEREQEITFVLTRLMKERTGE